MSDDLRTRISDIVYPLMPTEYPQPEDADEIADAVIRELNLAKACETGCMWHIPAKFEQMTPPQKELLRGVTIPPYCNACGITHPPQGTCGRTP